MFRFRRAWLFCPLLVLTLFFTACGWRNWNLSMDEEDVKEIVAEFAFSELPAYKVVYIADLSGGNYAGKKLSPRLLKYLSLKHPAVQFKHYSFPIHTSKPSGLIMVSGARIINRFHSECSVSRGSNDTLSGGSFVFTRSPFRFWDNKWHVVSSPEKLPPILIFP